MSLGSEYRKLWTASSISNLGDGVTFVAAPLLAASLTGDPTLVAGLSFVYTAPRILLTLVGGALADRLDRRWLMGAVNVFRAALLGVLGVALLAGWESLTLLYSVFLFLGVSETLFDSASLAILPAVVRKEDLERANGRLTTAQLVADEFVGPPLGGFLFAVAAALPFLLDAGSFAAAAALVLTLRGRFRAERGTPASSTMFADIREGVGWLARHHLLRALAVMLGLASVAYMLTFSILVLFVRDVLGLGETGYGVLLAFSAVGGLVGSAVAGPLSRRLGAGRTISVSLLIGAGSYAGIAVSSSPLFVGTMLASYIFYAVVWNVVTVSLRQSIVPDRMLGRVNSAYRLLGLTGLALGALLGGLLVSGFGLAAPFWTGAVLLGLMALISMPVVNNETIAEACRNAAPTAWPQCNL